MSEKAKRRLHLIYGSILSALIVAVGAALIWACADIYFNGDTSGAAGETQEEDTAVGDAEAGTEVGNLYVLPELPLVGTDAEGVLDSEATDGKLTILNFWFTTCTPCVLELPYFDQIAAEYEDRVNVVAVHADMGEPVEEWIAKHYPDTNMKVVLDPENKLYFDLIATGTFPATVVLDENGVIIQKIFTPTTYEELKAIAEKAPAPASDAPFTREAVAERFDTISILVYVCLAAIVGGVILCLVCPLAPTRRKGGIHPRILIDRMMKRVDTDRCDPELLTGIQNKHAWREIRFVLAAVLCCVLAIPVLIYLLNPVNFPATDPNGDIITAMKVVLPCTAIGLGACVGVTICNNASLNAELALVKQAVAQAPRAAATEDSEDLPRKTDRRLWIVRGVIAVVAIGFVLAGIFNGGMNDVLQKAIRICTECIGLG